MSIAESAAHDMINIAMTLSKQSSAYLLIDAAHRLDSTLNVEHIKAEWTNQAVRQEYIKRLELGLVVYSQDVTSK